MHFYIGRQNTGKEAPHGVPQPLVYCNLAPWTDNAVIVPVHSEEEGHKVSLEDVKRKEPHRANQMEYHLIYLPPRLVYPRVTSCASIIHVFRSYWGFCFKLVPRVLCHARQHVASNVPCTLSTNHRNELHSLLPVLSTTA
jgi:hypothetical protein